MVQKQISDPYVRAKNYALFLLKFRPRSRYEIEGRLKKKNFTPQIIKQTVDSLSCAGLINDLSFTKAWVENRLKYRPRSKRFLKYELLKKGVEKNIVDTVLCAIGEEKEYEIARNIAEKRAQKLKGDKKIREKLYAYLVRRGFNAAVALKILKELVKVKYG